MFAVVKTSSKLYLLTILALISLMLGGCGVDVGGESSASTPAVTPPPTAPLSLSSISGDIKVKREWSQEFIPCPNKSDVFYMTGGDIQICQYKDDEIQFIANSRDSGVSPTCRLEGIARAKGDAYLYADTDTVEKCEILFTPNADGMDVKFDKSCIHKKCESGAAWKNGEYEGEYTYKEKPKITESTWRFLAPITTHDRESPLFPGKGWLALRPTQEGWALTETVVYSKVVGSNVTEYDIEISSDHQGAIAMFNIGQLAAGRIDAAELPNGLLDQTFSIDTSKDTLFNITFKGKEYKFVAETNRMIPGDNIATDGVLIVESGEKMSFVGHAGQNIDNSEDTAMVVWAGDLDKDNNLDVIARVSGKNDSGLCVYLSSGATGVSLFGSTICHAGSGC